MNGDIKTLNLLYLAIVLIPTLYIVNGYGKKELVISSLTSIFRMVIQLFLVGLYLEYIFRLDNWLVNLTYLLVMMLVSTYSSVKSSSIKGWKIFILTFLCTLIPLGINLGIFQHLVLGLSSSFKAMYVIPIMGMILGNCLNSQILVLNDFQNSMKRSREEYLFSLSMGATRKEALKPYISQAMELALKPKIANMATLGIVSLPGMMTGQILGGALPMTAIKYQIAIMISIFCSSVMSAHLLINLLRKYYFDEYDMVDSSFVK